VRQKYHVIKAYESESPDPLKVRAGDRLRYERRQTQWPGWIWCTSETGKCGWVPEAWVEIEGDSCVMKRDYEAVELSVNTCDILEEILIESGWLLAKDANGNHGWVPHERVEAN